MDRIIRALVMDDYEDMLYLANIYLSQAGFEVICFSDVPKILDYLKDNNCDIIIMDYRQPQTTGLEITRKIKELYVHHANTPVLIHTANISSTVYKPDLNKTIMKNCFPDCNPEDVALIDGILPKIGTYNHVVAAINDILLKKNGI